MSTEEQIPNNGQEQSLSYREPTPNLEQEAIANMEQSVVTPADDINAAREKVAFETYVNTSGEQVPENFQDAGAWFESLKEAQGQYTQARQELAELKNVPAAEQTPAPVEPINPDLATDNTLRIPEPPAPPAEGEAPIFDTIQKEDWEQWSYEVAATGGLLPETKQEIMKKTGLSDGMVQDFVEGQQAKMREAYGKASSVVGSKDQLDNILRWAATSLSKEEQYSINAGLATPTLQDITLRGLEAKFNVAQAQKPTNIEPRPSSAEAEPIAATNPAFTSYQTMREFRQDRSDPKFTYDHNYRNAVEQRMLRTDFNNIPE